MGLLEDIFSKTPTGPLFHYTNQDGLLGIVKNKEIWASHTQYLNDQKEYIHAIALVKSVIEDSKNKYQTSLEQEILKEMKEGIDGNESMNVCVCSFSEEPDSLSQWRAYGGSSGFSIGFNASFLKSAIRKHNFNLASCLYTESEQVELLSAIVDKILKQNIELKDKGEYDHFPPGGGFCATMHRYAPIIKDESFKEEKEWRIISRPLACSFESFDFRPGKSMLVPYYRIPLIDESDVFNIQELIVGPTPNLDQSRNSAKSFLVKHDLEDIEVKKTKVPFREW